MDAKPDADLVALAREGNRDAYDELICRYQRQIFGLACRLLGDRFEAEDIAQETFLRAWLNLDALADPSKFAAWLRRIAFGTGIDWLRVFRPELYRLADADMEPALAAQASASESAFRTMERVELRQRVWDAVARLPERYRVPLTLFHFDGLNQSAVAKALGIQESTVRSLITRGRQKLEPGLRELFEEQQPGKPSILHITDGESVAGTLREAGIPGDVAIYGDLLYEGPAPADVSAEEWRHARAQFLSEAGDCDFSDAYRYLREMDAALDAALKHDEAVIWVDHRLSDQLILIRVLDWFSRHRSHRKKLSLISRGRYPGTDRFIGLGQLKPDQLASLAGTRLQVSPLQFQFASAAWKAFTSPDPTLIEQVLARDTSALPFLAAALRRHLEEFPSTVNGLSRTESQTLTILRDQGPLSPRQLFFAVQKMEESPAFMGNISFLRILRGLTAGKHPLIEAGGRLRGAEWESLPSIAIAETGLRVLAGGSDRIRLNGIDRWLGGAHLNGFEELWRWDATAGRLCRL